MKVVDGKFQTSKQPTSTKEKLLNLVEELNLADDDFLTEFTVVICRPDGYTNVGMSLPVPEAVFMLESAKLGLLMGEPEELVAH